MDFKMVYNHVVVVNGNKTGKMITQGVTEV